MKTHANKLPHYTAWIDFLEISNIAKSPVLVDPMYEVLVLDQKHIEFHSCSVKVPSDFSQTISSTLQGLHPNSNWVEKWA